MPASLLARLAAAVVTLEHKWRSTHLDRRAGYDRDTDAAIAAIRRAKAVDLDTPRLTAEWNRDYNAMVTAAERRDLAAVMREDAVDASMMRHPAGKRAPR